MSRMTRGNWVVLVLVVLATALSVGYGLKPADKKVAGTQVKDSASIQALQSQAALEPCPSGLGPAFPTQAFDCLGGGTYVYAASPGTAKPTLVNLYGSWCGPCLQEMPLLRRFHEAAGARVPLVGVDTKDFKDKGLLFAKDIGQHWPALFDDNGDIGRHLKLQPVPATLFVDATGKIVHIKTGPFATYDELTALTKRYLGVTV
jgi:cytochrome c biogenesis protein CcmG/thiol:disulfide interchange protein DsbE